MQIKSKNIIVKATTHDDLPDVQQLWNNGEVMKWVNFPNGLNVTLERLEKWLANIEQNDNLHAFVILHPELGFCGELFYHKEPEYKRAGLDIKLLPHTQGKGIATAGLQTLINYIFENEEDVDAVWTEPSAVNTAAQSLYSRCGLKPTERPQDLEPGDSFWQLTRAEWAKGE